MTSDREKEAYADLIGTAAFIIMPPSEQQRRYNEMTEGVSEQLINAFQQLFGRQLWPSMS